MLGITFYALRCYASAAEHDVAIVQDHRLAGRHGVLRAGERDVQVATRPRRHAGGDRRGMRSDLRLAVERRGGPFAADERYAAGVEGVALQRRARADDDGVARAVEPGDVERLAGGDAKPFALADRVERQAVVPANLAAVQIDDRAGAQAVGLLLDQQVAIVAAGDEADILALGAIG